MEGWRGEKGECAERKGGERERGTKKQVNKLTAPIKYLVFNKEHKMLTG